MKFIEYKRRKSSNSQGSARPKSAQELLNKRREGCLPDSSSKQDEMILMTPATSNSFRIKRDEMTKDKIKKPITRAETPDTLILDPEDDDLIKQDAQSLTPPPSPPRKKRLLEQRIRNDHEKKRLFQEEEYGLEEDDVDGKITQNVFSDDQIKEIKSNAELTTRKEEKKNDCGSSVDLGGKYKKIETETGRCMYAYFTQTNEDKLASFNPIWVNVGPPNLAKEMVCLR